jgi:RNA polymerase-binding transcription factor DksA
MIHRRESDRQALRRLLATERDSTLRQKASLEREFDSIVEASADVATDDEHDPEGTTIAFERAQVAALVERARARLTEFDDALERWTPVPTASAIGAGAQIPRERLAARPMARTCVACAATQGRRRSRPA